MITRLFSDHKKTHTHIFPVAPHLIAPALFSNTPPSFFSSEAVAQHLTREGVTGFEDFYSEVMVLPLPSPMTLILGLWTLTTALVHAACSIAPLSPSLNCPEPRLTLHHDRRNKTNTSLSVTTMRTRPFQSVDRDPSFSRLHLHSALIVV